MSKKVALLVMIISLASLIVGSKGWAQVRLSPSPDTGKAAISGDELFLDRSLRAVRNFISVGDYNRAASMIASLEKTYGSDDRIINEKKRLLRAQKNFPELKKLVESELAKKPDDFNLLCQLGEAYFLLDSLNLADSTWQVALDEAGKNEFNYLLLANYYRGYGFYDEAASVYTRGREVLNNPRLFSSELSDIYLAQREYLKAVQENLSMIRTNSDPANIANITRVILSIYNESENPDLVREAIEQASQNDPDRPEVYTILGDIYVKEGKLADAFENYKKADNIAGGDGRFLLKFTQLCFGNQAYDMAIQSADYYFEKMAGSNAPLSYEISLIKAKSLAELGSYQPAFDMLKTIEQGSRTAKAQADAIFAAGEIYADKLGDYATAEAEFSRILEKAKGTPVAFQAELRLAEIDITKGEFDEATPRLDDVIKGGRLDATTEKADFLKAEILFFTDKFDEATAEYRRIAFQYPRGFYGNDCLDRLALLSDATGDSVLNSIAKAAWYHHVNRIDSAIAILKDVSMLSNSKAYEYVLYLLPRYYADSGNWQTAIGAYERYLTSFEAEGVYTDKVLYNLALLYYEKADQPNKADQLLNKLVSEYPNSPLIEKARIYLNALKAS